MKTIEYVAMQSDYSARTLGARNVIDATWPVVQSAMNITLNEFKAPVFQIGDFGTADGGTSYPLIRQMIQHLRDHDPALPVHLTYSDLPRNDFNALIHRAEGIHTEDGPLRDQHPQLTYCASGTSFYNQVMPPETLSLGFSATAMHWLNEAPAALSDHIHMAVSTDTQSLAAFRDQGQGDLLQILRHRATEMHSGAHFVLVNFGISHDGKYLGHTEGVNMFDRFYQGWHELVVSGEIEESELLATNFPQIYRGEQDYRRAVSDPSLLQRLELADIQEMLTECPYKAHFRETGDKDWFIKNYPETLETWSYPVFFSGLSDERSEEERHALVRKFFDRYREDIADRPEEHGMDYVHHVVTFRKR